MPWKIEDVDSHKKGLTEKQKRQWVRISNSVLKAEMKKGKDEKEAAASAIRQANGVVINTNENKGVFSNYKTKQVLNYEVKLAVHQEKAHLIIPVVMMVEGVHNGSQGPIFHSIAELGKFPASWNGIPVVIYHPEEDGSPVSANSPDVIDKRTVGRVYNTSVDGKKLKAEVWLDEDKLNNISSATLEDVNETKEVEVSLGMFTENDPEEGEYEGEQFIAIAKNHRPDHLAILPDQIGACSCADGCGLGVNKKDEDMKNAKKKCNNEEEDDIEDKQEDEIKHGIEIIPSVATSTGNLTRTKFKTNIKEESIMSTVKCPKCLEKIDALIANMQSPFVEADREWLLTQEESMLDKFTPVVNEVEKIVEKIVEVNKLTPEQEADLAQMAQQKADKRSEMVKGVQANTDKVWSDEKLSKMDDETLEGIYKSVVKENVTVDYSLNGSVPKVQSNTSGSGGSLYPAGVVIK